MKITVLSDIHATREALAACLAASEAVGRDRLVILGDIVGYGADPEWCLDTVRGILAAGAVALLGNHDDAASKATQSMTDNPFNPAFHIAIKNHSGIYQILAQSPY